MQVGRRKAGTRNGVVAGSVWESRMKLDEVKGGIKVFHGGDAPEEKRRRWKPEVDKVQMELRKSRSDPRRISDENGKESGVGRRKTVQRSLSNGGQVESSKVVMDDGDGEDEEGAEEEEEVEAEVEKERFEIKEMNVAEEKPGKNAEEDTELRFPPLPKSPTPATKDDEPFPMPVLDDLPQKPQLATSSKEDKQPVAPQIPKSPISVCEDKKPHPLPLIDRFPRIPKSPISVYEDKKTQPLPLSERFPQIPKLPIVANKIRKQLPPTAIEHPPVDPDLRKLPSRVPVPHEAFQSSQRNEIDNRLQGIIDLVMWKDIPKTALVFGLGTFTLIPSSFAKDLNFSFISATSYMGLIYLAVVFFYKSVLLRGAMDREASDKKYLVGEEEAVWVAKMILPYLNELLFNLRSVFSGDPATTMKLAILLFILARCGSSITLWTMARLAFFGVFTVPKLCCTYTSQLIGYGKFWGRRFADAWQSCTHKRVVAAAVFTVMWNLSSVVARIWAVFMLIVAVKFYQQSSADRDSHHGPPVHGNGNGGPTLMSLQKDC